MSFTTEEFMTNFHSLTGSTIGERRKSLFLLLNRTKQTDYEHIDFSLIQPKTHLEENFKVQTLLYFRKVPNLIDIFKSENPILIDRILLKENSWFLDEIFNYTTEKYLVENIFPLMSFNTKVKLINKLSLSIKNTKRGDACFAAIEKRYGNYLATKLLPCCSSNLIMQCLKSFKFELTSRQLLIIVKKHPLVIEDILDALNYFWTKEILVRKYHKIFVHVLNTDLSLFLKLSQDWKLCFRVGWRSTDRSVRFYKDSVISNAIVLCKYLHRKQITKSLGTDFNQFYLKMFPASLSCFKDKMEHYIELMNYLPKSVSKINLLLNTFQSTYGSELWQHSRCVTKSVLELMSVDERESWMKCYERPHNMPEVVWICLMKTDKSIALLIKKISLTSDIKDRAELCGCLVETCRINNDKVALAEACKYMVVQHRNDNSCVIYCFLKSLQHCYNLNEFSELHWKYINEMVQIIISRKESPYYYDEWLYGYTDYLLSNSLPVREHMGDLSKQLHLGGQWHLNMKKVKTQKTCLLTFGEVIPDLYKEDDFNLTVYFMYYFDSVIGWNRKYPKDKIPMPFQLTIKTLRDFFIEENLSLYPPNTLLGYLLSLDLNPANIDQCFELLLNRSNVHIAIDVFLLLIKYKPLSVAKYIDYITKFVLGIWHTGISSYFWTFSRNYSHLDIPQKMIAICMKALNAETESNKSNTIMALSCLMNAAEFKQLIVPYYPDDSIMDVNDSDKQNVYKLQRVVSASLKNVIPASVILDSVFSFSKGDYMKLILRALHSVSDSTAEANLIPFYLTFANCPVSIRKHPVYLTFKVLDKAEIYNMLARLETTEKNSSILKFIFKAAFNHFIKNPKDGLWQLVKNLLKRVDVNDVEIYYILIQIEKIPRLYLSQYLTFTFEFLDNSSIACKKVEEYKTCLLGKVTSDVVASLPEAFAWDLIKKHLFQGQSQSTALSEQVQLFACRFAVYTVEETRIVNLFDVLKRYIAATWHTPNSKSRGRQYVGTFIKHFCSIFLNDKKAPRHALQKFIDLWNDWLKPHDCFDEYLQLQFTSVYVSYIDEDLNSEQVATKLCNVCNKLSVYDCVISTELGESLNAFLSRFLKGSGDIFDVNRLNLIMRFINTQIRMCIFVAISLLPMSISDTDEVKGGYEKVIDAIDKIDDPGASFYLSLYFDKVSAKDGYFVSSREGVSRYKPSRGMWSCIEVFNNKYRQ